MRGKVRPVMTVRNTTRAWAFAVVSVLAVAAVPGGQVSAATGRAAACRSIGASFTDKMIPGQCITNGANRLEMQYDGNLVLYSGSRACWASGTDGTDGVYAEFSGDWKPDSPTCPWNRSSDSSGSTGEVHRTAQDRQRQHQLQR